MPRRCVRVTVQVDGVDLVCGTLDQSVRNGRESLAFSYDAGYLEHPRAFALSPDMPLGPGAFYSSGVSELRVFGDCMPDRWGRNLMRREEARIAREEARTPRTLFDLDLLCGVDDAQRQGAIRLWDEDGVVLSAAGAGVPREVELPALLDAADLAADDLSADVRDLFAAGSSLGGARPKASVVDADGTLSIAKFPRKGESALDDVCAWEKVALDIFAACGLAVPASRLLRLSGRSVLLVKRFDREGVRRIPYLSGISAIGGRDGADGYSYLDLADFLAQEGADARADKRHLWLHALLSAALGNTDNHMRNFGFLRDGRGRGWCLSPFFDVNPTRLETGRSFAVGVADADAPHSVETVMECAGFFDVGQDEARALAGRARDAVADWRRFALSAGIKDASVEAMRGRMESGIADLGRFSLSKS
jgi:serine/threonine-protein kinase HipA